ncbi:ATC1 Protein ATC1/LIC4 [Candida maltosa Xu316]
MSLTPLTSTTTTSKEEVQEEVSPIDLNNDQQLTNDNTVNYLKDLMINNSKTLGLYSLLKTTYLKLCKEFNFLLKKFNENEKIKLKLIEENELLKQMINDLLDSNSNQSSTTTSTITKKKRCL